MEDTPTYVGLDLGTSNSAAAVFDGEQVVVVRSAQGGVLTPSVVRVDRRGRVVVGQRAARWLDRDPDNTRTGFKRLMGTGRALAFPAAGQARTPTQLTSAVVAHLLADVEVHLGARPTAAAVAVPALFEVPQSAATSSAAREAGLERVELIQEPVASALAAGWSASSGGRWLVYDFGGGTFDASLLEGREGLLRVVGHDGDNFLGGRDLDRVVVDWALRCLGEAGSAPLRRDAPSHAAALRSLSLAAEEARIELSTAPRALLTLAEPVEVDGAEVDVELELTRADLEALISPLLDRTLEVCHRLLRDHGMGPGDLERVVLVGGPTVTPALRERVAQGLAPLAAEALDPMTLVAQGTALFAASAGLEARARPARRAPGRHVNLLYPTMTSDPRPFVVGRLLGEHEPPVARVRLSREGWTGDWEEVDPTGTFDAEVELVPRSLNTFRLEARSGADQEVRLSPATLRIVHGLTIGDPPLSRSVGVARANDTVHVYFDRGTPLPSRRTFTHSTVTALHPGAEEAVLRIPIVQGELDEAHLCRLVGTLEIAADALTRPLPVGSEVQVTLELDRGGRLSAQALLPATQQLFQEVAHLLVPQADPEAMAASLAGLRQRVASIRAGVDRRAAGRLLGMGAALDIAAEGIAAARGGDEDAGQRARRALLDLEADLDALEDEGRWPELEHEAMLAVAAASQWVGEYGTPTEQHMLEKVALEVRRALDSRSPRDLQRHLRVVRRLGTTSHFRHPRAWAWAFDHAASQVSRAADLRLAEELVRRGREARRSGDTDALRAVTTQLYELLPADAEAQRQAYLSGVR